MKLIAFESGAVAQYHGADVSPQAIEAFVKKSGGKDWREITPDDYAAIRAARAKPTPAAQASSTPPADADTLAKVIAAYDALKRDHEALKETVRQIITHTHLTDVRNA